MGKAMVIGCGGVASVAIHKMCQNSDVFSEVVIASRTVSKCDALKEKLEGTTKTKITTAQVDADDTAVLTALIRREKPDVVVNLALPYQDLLIMEACLAAGVHYIDTANYEPEDTAKFEYKWQWEYRERFEKAGLTALLGCGFDRANSTFRLLPSKSDLSIVSRTFFASSGVLNSTKPNPLLSFLLPEGILTLTGSAIFATSFLRLSSVVS